MQVGLPGGTVPADHPVTFGHLPGRGAPTETGHQAAVKIDQILEVGADDPGGAEIVVAID